MFQTTASEESIQLEKGSINFGWHNGATGKLINYKGRNKTPSKTPNNEDYIILLL
jgi:hypothetical protein